MQGKIQKELATDMEKSQCIVFTHEVYSLTVNRVLYSLLSNHFNVLSDYYWLQSLALVQEAGWSKGGTYFTTGSKPFWT